MVKNKWGIEEIPDIQRPAIRDLKTAVMFSA